MNEQEKEYVKMLEWALIDLMDGKAWDEIQRTTGLSTDRCYELENLVYKLCNKHFME